MNVTLLVTIGAPLVIIAFIVYSDKFKEPLDLILKTFFLGIFLCIPAGELNSWLIQSPDQSYFAGLTEESLKFIILYFYIRPKAAFNEPMDAIVYAVCISLGFATLENIMYVYNSGTSAAMYVAILRGLTAVPAHALFGLTMGLMFINYSFIKKNNYNLLMCFIYPTIMHATYNFLVGHTNLFLVIIILIITWRIQLRKFRALKALQ